MYVDNDFVYINNVDNYLSEAPLPYVKLGGRGSLLRAPKKCDIDFLKIELINIVTDTTCFIVESYCTNKIKMFAKNLRSIG